MVGIALAPLFPFMAANSFCSPVRLGAAWMIVAGAGRI
jgi:hypothetical protein